MLGQCLLRIEGPCPGYERPAYRSWWPASPGVETPEACIRRLRKWQATCGSAAIVHQMLQPKAPAAAAVEPSIASPPPAGAPPIDMPPSVLHVLDAPVSAHVCQGGEDEPVQHRAEERTCLFKNLCYNRSAHGWQYHRQPELAPPPSWTHVGTAPTSGEWEDPRVQTEFRAPVTTSSGFNEGFFVKAVDAPIPEHAQWVDGLSYFRQPLGPWANAIGHMYAEYTYPIWHAMDVFGLVTRDARVLMRDTPCNTVRPTAKGNKCTHFHTLMRGLSDRYRDPKSVARPNFPPPRSKGSNGNGHGQQLVCYRSMLVGDGTLHGSSRRHAPESWGKFMHFWLAGIGIEPRARPPAQRIIFVNKGGTAAGGAHRAGANRVALNGEEVMRTLASTFNVPVDSWVWNGETLEQEVAMLQRYSVCIAVCGGTAFSCTHLPDGASNIYVSVWSSSTASGRPGNNNNMESVTWTWDSRHRHYAYPVWLNETTPDDSIRRHPQYEYGMRWKHNLGFRLHTGRLALLLNDALAQSRWRMFAGDAKSGGYRPLTRRRLAELNGDAPSGVVPWR